MPNAIRSASRANFTAILRSCQAPFDPESSLCREIVGVLSGAAGIVRHESAEEALNGDSRAWRRGDVAPETPVVCSCGGCDHGVGWYRKASTELCARPSADHPWRAVGR